MKYDNVVKGTFISRPNRFIANVMIDGRCEKAHVKNTGRCRELLREGAAVYLQHHENTKRSTEWSLICVEKGNRLVNIDSQAPNKIIYEWLQERHVPGECFRKSLGNIKRIKPEFPYGESRIDFYMETEKDKILIEVKGVTLEENNIAMFPDAPTERGIRHIQELCRSLDEGFKAYILFVIQMEGVRCFTPNAATHKAFADALKYAYKKGVVVAALDCIVRKEFLGIGDEVRVVL